MYSFVFEVMKKWLVRGKFQHFLTGYSEENGLKMAGTENGGYSGMVS